MKSIATIVLTCLIATVCLAGQQAARMDLLCGVHDGGNVRADKPDAKQGNRLLIVGGLDNGTALRGMITIDLSAIPEGATIRTATMRMFIHTRDTRGGEAPETTVELRLLEQRPTEYVRWNGPDSKRTWATPGGDFAATPLTQTTLAPDQVRGDDEVAFDVSDALTEAVRNARAQAEPTLSLAVIAPQAEANAATDGRSVIRFHGPNGTKPPMLTVEYDLP